MRRASSYFTSSKASPHCPAHTAKSAPKPHLLNRYPQICYNAYWLFRRSFLYVLTKNLTPLERPYPPRDSDPTNSVSTLNQALARKNERVRGYKRNLVWAWTRVYWQNAWGAVVKQVRRRARQS